MEYETITAKKMLTPVKDNNWWFKYDYNMNIYRGCSHGCIYCDSRSDCYGIENFDVIKVKENAIKLLSAEARSKHKKGVVCFGSMSDPYNPLERDLELTRKSLKILELNGFGVSIFTKSDLITRDIDIFRQIRNVNVVNCCITVTTASDELCKRIEPRVALTSERMKAIRKLSDAGIFVGIAMMPVLPYINDDSENIKAIIAMAADNGARYIFPNFGVTLRSNQREYYFKQIDKPDSALSKKYKMKYGANYYCPIPNYKEIKNIFIKQCNKYGILYKIKDINSEISKTKKHCEQLSFFE